MHPFPSQELKTVFYYRKKAQAYMFDRVLNTPLPLYQLQLYQLHALQLKKTVKISHTNTNLFKDSSANILAWNISLIPYNSHENQKTI